MDKTSYWWTGLCGICHPGGGPAEYDRDGERYYDETTGQFGYEKLGKTAAQVVLDGDYSVVSNQTGTLSVAHWDRSGVSEPDCLLCHRKDRVVNQGRNMNWIWRAATLRSGANLQDGSGNAVPGFAAAATATQGWFSVLNLANVPAGKPPLATDLLIDYDVGVQNGSLTRNRKGEVVFAGDHLVETPVDLSCWGCHVTPDLKKRGRVWFDPAQDVHYRAFNNLHDQDPTNDIAMEDSTACTRCHPSGMDHNFAKGSAFLGSVQNETDYRNFRTCQECHAANSPNRDRDARPPTSDIHSQEHLNAMACQFCHAPYKNAAAQNVVDNSTTGSSIAYDTDVFLSANPIDPNFPGDDRWWPSARLKEDRDGRMRLYPDKLLLSIWWGDWDDGGTPLDFSDDVIQPIALWRVRQATGNMPLPGVTDDNGDGKPEVNTRAEMLLYFAALRGNDSHGTPFATRPVLVKGGQVWYEDPTHATLVNHWDYEGTGAGVESSHPFSIDHNIRPAQAALRSCASCHPRFSGGREVAVFDRRILVDPWDENGRPVYKTLREVTGISPR